MFKKAFLSLSLFTVMLTAATAVYAASSVDGSPTAPTTTVAPANEPVAITQDSYFWDLW